MEKEHLDWSDKQRRILTADGKAEEYYTSERGFPFESKELPHYYLLLQQKKQQQVEEDDDVEVKEQEEQEEDSMSSSSTLFHTRLLFRQWKRSRDNEDSSLQNRLIGAWKRTLFYGGWSYIDSAAHENVFNLQTGTLFIDLRIPKSRNALLVQQQQTGNAVASLQDMTGQQLRYYARQHVFAGYTRMNVISKNMNGTVTPPWHMHCTRHHVIDWNFVGVGRTRPNKWWVEWKDDPSTTISAAAAVNSSSHDRQWKEWAYATDTAGQHYYCEYWERLLNRDESTDGLVLAFRKMKGRDGVIIIVGDHFSYCLERDLTESERKYSSGHGSLVSVVDAAVEANDLDMARAWLSAEGGHGCISAGWLLDCSIEFWKEGTALWNKQDVVVQGDSIDNCRMIWNNEPWELFERSSDVVNVSDVQDVLWKGL